MSVIAFHRLGPGHEPTLFKQYIQQGSKVHTFRMNYSRKPGEFIYFWENHPRNANSNAKPFTIPKDKADFWGVNKEGVELPRIAAIEGWTMIFDPANESKVSFKIGDMWIANVELLETIAMADGFKDIPSFFHWFRKQAERDAIKTIGGQLIHWKTSTVYDTSKAAIFKPKKRKA